MAKVGDVAEGPGWRLHCGRWQDVLADVETCDAVITDPPYSERTEKGFRTSRDLNARGLGYEPIDRRYAEVLVSSWSSRCNGWMFVCGDHVSNSWMREAMEGTGRYTFPPLPIVKIGAAPRLHCDGPGSQSEWIAVSRPRRKEFMGWGSLPGWYSMHTVRHGHDHCGVSGAKSVDFMRAVVRDYSRPGDIIVEPHAGSGTTLLAAVMEGRRAIGSEMDPDTFDKAVKRLRRGYTPDLFTAVTEDDEPEATQGEMFT